MAPRWPEPTGLLYPAAAMVQMKSSESMSGQLGESQAGRFPLLMSKPQYVQPNTFCTSLIKVVRRLRFILVKWQESQRLPPCHAHLKCKLTGNQFGSRVSPGLSVTPTAYVTFSFLGEQQVCKEEGRRDSPIYETNKTVNVYHKLVMCGRKVWF